MLFKKMVCHEKMLEIENNPKYLNMNFYGNCRKTITQDMICFQQAATSYLHYYK
jgi:hypothetical protein